MKYEISCKNFNVIFEHRVQIVLRLRFWKFVIWLVKNLQHHKWIYDYMISYADKDRDGDGGISYEEFVDTVTKEYAKVWKWEGEFMIAFINLI